MKELDNATVKEFVTEIMKEHSTTCWLEFARDDNYIWAYVFGYLEEPNDLDMIGVKEAYCPINSAMNEYDFDWNMPFEKDTGEVDDTETFYTIYEDSNIPDIITRICKDLKYHNNDAQRFMDTYVGKYVEDK